MWRSCRPSARCLPIRSRPRSCAVFRESLFPLLSCWSVVRDCSTFVPGRPEQFAEIKTQFSQFDKDKSGAIDIKELRATLYSLGDERTGSEVKKIMEEFGVDDGKERVMKYEGFKEFMIRQL